MQLAGIFRQGNLDIFYMTKIKIAFDLDGIIIDKPPLIPKKLLERLFKGKGNGKLHYRFPHSKLEQKIRKLSHFYLFRPPIRKNIEFIKKLANDNNYELFVVSGRYSFIKDETKVWFEKRGLENVFKNIFLNSSDKQPHLFKEEKLREIDADIFVDDDCLIITYLLDKIKGLKIFCYSQDNADFSDKGVNFVKNLNEII